MKLRTCLAVVVAFLAGCSFISRPKSPNCSHVTPIVDTLVVVAGLATLVAAQGQSSGGAHSAGGGAGFAIIPAAIGGFYLPSVVYGWAMALSCDREVDPEEVAAARAAALARVAAAQAAAAAAARAAAYERARELTNQALAAARAGQCATVVKLGATVKQLDTDLYESVFARDDAIARCLASPPAPE